MEKKDGLSNEDWAVVAEEVEADVSEMRVHVNADVPINQIPLLLSPSVVCPSDLLSSVETALRGSALSLRRPEPKRREASKDL